MNGKPLSEAKSKLLSESYPAMLRAAKAARRIAAQTNTKVVILRNGVLEYIDPNAPTLKDEPT